MLSYKVHRTGDIHKNPNAFWSPNTNVRRVFTWDFISGKMKYFQVGVWSISYKSSHEIYRNETRVLFHCGYFDRNEILFRVIKCYVNTTQVWNPTKWNICACEHFIKTKIVDQKLKKYTSFLFARNEN